MWPFKRKAKNQRLRQRNVLHVKSSTAQLRRHRFRVLFYTTTASLAVLFVLYVGWRSGEWVLNRLVYENKAYALVHLDIQTDGVLASDQIRRWAGVKLGDNLFTLDLGRIRRDLELASVIQSVAVERVLPQTLRIHVQEREPVAQIITTVVNRGENPQSVVYLLDGEGHVMLPLQPRQRAIPPTAAEQYPVISGACATELTPGKAVDSPQIRAALRLVAAFEHSPMAGLVELKRIDVVSPDVLQVTTDQQSEVGLRSNDLERELNRWRLVYDLGVQQGRPIASLDLSVGENIPLRWLEGNPLPPSGPKVKKTSPYKKKHV
jgi:cell division septal protein FtsQ